MDGAFACAEMVSWAGSSNPRTSSLPVLVTFTHLLRGSYPQLSRPPLSSKTTLTSPCTSSPRSCSLPAPYEPFSALPLRHQSPIPPSMKIQGIGLPLGLGSSSGWGTATKPRPHSTFSTTPQLPTRIHTCRTEIQLPLLYQTF